MFKLGNYKPILYSIIGGIISFNKLCITGKDLDEILIALVTTRAPPSSLRGGGSPKLLFLF